MSPAAGSKTLGRTTTTSHFAETTYCLEGRSATRGTQRAHEHVYVEEQCLIDFRFRQTEIGRIAQLTGWDGGRKERNAYRCSGLYARCILLRRMESPCRYRDIEQVFGMHTSALSEIF